MRRLPLSRAGADVRVRVVLAVGVLLVAGALAIDMSGRAVRTAGSDHFKSLVFTAVMPPRSTLCQSVTGLPQDAARVRLQIGSYGTPLPPLDARFLTSNGDRVASGHIARGATEGEVTIPLRHVPQASGASIFCLHSHGSGRLAVGGEYLPPGPWLARVNGRPQLGPVSLFYLRDAPESWWQMLGLLARRFHFGKAPFFDTWTLPLLAVLLLGVWIATVRLLVRELS